MRQEAWYAGTTAGQRLQSSCAALQPVWGKDLDILFIATSCIPRKVVLIKPVKPGVQIYLPTLRVLSRHEAFHDTLL